MRPIPLSVILTWPKPNYVDPPTRGSSLVVLNSTLMGVIVILVSLRYYTRLRITRWFGVDDILIGFSLLACIGLNVTVTLANTRYGWNRHVYDIPFPDIPSALKLAMLTKVWFTVGATFTRAALLSFYARLVGNSGSRKIKWTIWISHFLNAASGILMLCLAIFLCNPVSEYWRVSLHAWKHCLSEGATMLAGGTFMSIMDLVVTLVPLPIIMNLQMPVRQRLGVLILLSLGFFVTVVGAVRIYYTWDCFLNSYDESWASYPLYICATIEVDFGVICACIPTLRPLFVQYFGAESRLHTESGQWSTTIHTITGSRPRPARTQSMRSSGSGSELTAVGSPTTPTKHLSKTFSEMQDSEIFDNRPWRTNSTEEVLAPLSARPAVKDPGWHGSAAMRALITQNLQSSYAEARGRDDLV